MNPTIYYCYDAYCGWCYGFSPVIRKIAAQYSNKAFFEVLSGGMILTDHPVPISASASYIQKAYKTVESHTGIRFGADYLWHIMNPEESDWFPNSEKPAIALCIFKELFPYEQVAFACDLQYALHYEGRDLCDDEAYKHLLDKYQVEQPGFFAKLHSNEYREKAYYEFSLVKQLQVKGFPAVLVGVSDSKFYWVASGFTDYDTLSQRTDQVLTQIPATP